MKRIINIFVLLCMLVFMMSGIAWAAEIEITSFDLTMSDGDTLKLTKNILVLSNRVTIDKAITIDLNGKSIEGSGQVLEIKGNVTIKGTGTIRSSGSKVGVVWVYANATLTVESGVTIEGVSDGWGIVVKGDGSSAANLFFDGKINLINGSYAISGIGNTWDSPTNITIGSNAQLSSTGGTGSKVIYHPQRGTLTINGGTFTGEGGIEMKAGNLFINGGTFSNNGATPSSSKNSNGASTSGYVLSAVINNAYQGDGNITITGGTFTGPISIVADDNENQKYQPKVQISGGTFNTKPDDEYIASGYVVTQSGSNWVVGLPAAPESTSDGSTNTEPEEEQTTQAKNESAIDNIEIEPDDDTPEAQQALDDAKDAAKEALAKAETEVELSPEEVVALVQNQKAIAEDLETEKNNGGEVVKTTVPAASNLLEESSIAKLDELSAAPKVTEPALPTQEEHTKIEQNLNNLDNLVDVTEEDKLDIPPTFNPTEVVQATSATIEIYAAEKKLEAQAEAIQDLYEEIKEFMTAEITGSNEDDKAQHGVVVATLMPAMKPLLTGWFPLKINMRNLVPGQRPRFWINPAAFKKAAGGSTASLASLAEDDLLLSAEEGDAFFLDGEGNPTTTIKGDASKMVVVAYLEQDKTYESAFITVDATEKDKAALEDMLAAEQESDDGNDDVNNSSSGGGGCNSIRSEAGAPLAELGVRSVLLMIALFSLAFVKISLKR